MFLGNQKVRFYPTFSPYRHSHVFIHKPRSTVVTLRRCRRHTDYPIRTRSINVTSSRCRRNTYCHIRHRRRRYHSYSHRSNSRGASIFTSCRYAENTCFHTKLSDIGNICVHIREGRTTHLFLHIGF